MVTEGTALIKHKWPHQAICALSAMREPGSASLFCLPPRSQEAAVTPEGWAARLEAVTAIRWSHCSELNGCARGLPVFSTWEEGEIMLINLLAAMGLSERNERAGQRSSSCLQPPSEEVALTTEQKKHTVVCNSAREAKQVLRAVSV